MAPFQYTPYENRLAGSIGDILARRGEIAAAAAQRAGVILSNGTRQQGDIAARATEQSGQAWAGAAGQAAHAAAAIPEQARQAQAQDQESTLRQGAIDDRKRQVGELQALDGAYQKSGGNRDAIIQALPGHMRGKVAADFENFDKIHAESVALQEKADAAKTAAFAAAGMSIRGHGYDPVAAQLTISDLKGKYAKDPQAMSQIAQFEAKLHSDPTPDSIKSMIDPILQADPKTREDLLKEAADAETKRNHDLLKTDREATAAETAKRDTATATNAEAMRKQGEERLRIERINAGTATAREKREHDIYEQQYGALSTNPDGTPKAVPVSATTKAIAEYKVQPPSPRAPNRKAQLEAVLQYNPSYDEKEYPTRSKMRAAYTSGNQSQQLGALNTAIEHLGVLDGMVKALDNGSFKPGNELVNRVKTIFGNEAVTNFEFARDIMSGELATAMKKSGATDVEISKVTKSLDGAGSPKQLGDAIRTVAIPMIGGKAGTMDQQYHAVMGDKDPYSVYTPGAKAVLDTLGGKTPAAAVVAPGGGKGGGSGAGPQAAAPKEGDKQAITDPGYPPGAEKTFQGGKWIRTK